jgi:hypothetical protein
MAAKDEANIGPDAKAWIRRLREVNQGSQFTMSERAFIEQRLSEIERDLICIPHVGW